MVMAWEYMVQEERCERGWEEEDDDVEESGELMQSFSPLIRIVNT